MAAVVGVAAVLAAAVVVEGLVAAVMVVAIRESVMFAIGKSRRVSSVFLKSSDSQSFLTLTH